MSEVFVMPKAVKITGRTSSITNSFVNGIIPVIQPSEEEIDQALSLLGMKRESVCCAYCGDPMTEWDHFRPLVIDKLPSGYITEIHNLVPACSKCNQSKGNKNWKEWMDSDAKKSPRTRGVKNIENRMKCLEEYEKWDNDKGYPMKIDIKGIIGEEKWKKHWDNCQAIKTRIYDSQSLSDEIKKELKKSIELTGKASYGKIESDEKMAEKINNDKCKISKLVKEDLIELIGDEGFPSELIESLCDKEYSRKEFCVNYPVLIAIATPEDYKKRYDATNHNRYYSSSYYIHGKEYLLTSQWFEKNRTKLLDWIKANTVN